MCSSESKANESLTCYILFFCLSCDYLYDILKDVMKCHAAVRRRKTGFCLLFFESHGAGFVLEQFMVAKKYTI